MGELDRILSPKSVAIIGASNKEGKTGYRMTKELLESGYEGAVFPINPSDEMVLGMKAYPTVSEVPGRVDLAYIVTPAEIVPTALEGCGEKDVGGAVVMASGFGEVGNYELEAEVLKVAQEKGIRIVGPNVMGLVNVHDNLSIGGGTEYPPGGLAIVSQSGNVGITMGRKAKQYCDVGFSFFISVGNEADIGFHEYVEYLATHDETEAIVLYVEGMEDGKAFLETAKVVAQKKPILALKGGWTRAGKSSAESHTASLAGKGEIIADVYTQAGVHRIDSADVSSILAAAEALIKQPSLDGDRIGIMTEGGGHATLAADALSKAGLSVPAFSEETQSDLDALYPYAPNVTNPVDTTVTPETASQFADCAEVILADDAIDGLLVTGSFGGYGTHVLEGEEMIRAEREAAERIAALPGQFDKPIVVQSEFAMTDSGTLETCRDLGLPVYDSMDTIADCLATMAAQSEFENVADETTDFVLESTVRPDTGGEGYEILREALDTGRRQLSEVEAKQLLAAEGVPVGPFELVTDREEAVAAAESVDGPVALKIVSPDLSHKTEVGGVILDVEGPDAVRAAYDDISEDVAVAAPEATIHGVLVSPMVDEGVELIVGVVRDKEVGPVLLFGLGGVFVEVFQDTAFRAIPLTEFDARSAIDSIEASPILEGVRGQSGVDREALVDLLLTVSEFAARTPVIRELDLNPVVASGDGVTALDASITLVQDTG